MVLRNTTGSGGWEGGGWSWAPGLLTSCPHLALPPDWTSDFLPLLELPPLLGGEEAPQGGWIRWGRDLGGEI